MKIRILIADDIDFARNNLKRRLSEIPDCEVCGEAADGDSVVLQARALRPDLVILDLALPGSSGFEAGRQILRDWPQCRIFLYTLFGADRLEDIAIAAGFLGVFIKGEESKLLRAIEALRTAVAAGDLQSTDPEYAQALPAY